MMRLNLDLNFFREEADGVRSLLANYVVIDDEIEPCWLISEACSCSC